MKGILCRDQDKEVQGDCMGPIIDRGRYFLSSGERSAKEASGWDRSLLVEGLLLKIRRKKCKASVWVELCSWKIYCIEIRIK